MSGSASLASALALAPVFVVKFGSGRFNKNGRTKTSQNDNSYWHVCDSLCPRPSFAISSPFSLFVLIFLVILCSIGGEDGVKGSEISASLSPTLLSNNDNGVPSFDLNDLRNLIEIFPEFREYVLQVVSSHVEKQQQQQQQYRISDYVTSTTEKSKAFPLSKPIDYDGGTTQISRKDYLSFSPQTSTFPQLTSGQKTSTLSKHSYDWPLYDDYHPIHTHNHHSHNYGYGYGPPSHSHNGWGWSSNHAHHHETLKDPKFHYQAGYQLGKDVSCVLGLLGFKSIKDFSIYSIFSFLKKLKYLALIGLAFKLGVILSPVALPLLFPFIILAVIAKLLPLLLIVVLLFKLLKTQLKLGIGRRIGESEELSGGSISSFMEGTNIARLWKSIDDVTQTVVESESCMEKIVCKMIKGNKRGNNSTFTDTQDIQETSRGIAEAFSGSREVISSFVFNIMNWIFPTVKMNSTIENSVENLWDCDKIQCSYMENISQD